MTESARYHAFSKLLHWLIAAMIVLQFILAQLADYAGDNDAKLRELALLANHKSVGITIFALALLRLGWRFVKPPPALPGSMKRWQVVASHISHWGLYGLIILMPFSGLVMADASAYGASWFGLVQMPDLIARSETLEHNAKEVHELLGSFLFIIAAVHILAALKHHFLDRDEVLARMSSAVSVGLFVVVLAGGGWALGSVGKKPAAGAEIAEAAGDAEITISDSGLPAWRIDYDTSYIRFTGDQAGASFDGYWPTWSARIRFDGDDPGSSSFDVTIMTADVETDDDDRDSTLQDPEWFDTDNHPEAYYRATDFAANPDGSYDANGQLVIKGKASPVVLTFTVEEDGDRRVLTGDAEMLRLELGVGTGEWEDTSWVSNEVTVDVRVEAAVESE